MNTGQALIVGPGSAAQALHRDAGNWPISMLLRRDDPEATVSIMLAISDFKADTGATQVVPGSHVWEDYDRIASPEEITQAVMPAGSALMYTGRTVHGAGANVTEDQWRYGIHMSSCLGQFTPEEAHPVVVPWEAAQNFPERVKHMLGYYSHRTFLPDWPVLWTSDYHELRDSLTPKSADIYVSAGAAMYLGDRLWEHG